MACYCCVFGCRNNNHKMTDKHFFRFPKNDEKRQRLWKKFTKRKKINPTSVICSDHFDPQFVLRKDKKLKLTKDAVPTVYLNRIDNEVEKIMIDYDGSKYFGPEADKLQKVTETMKMQEIIAFDAAFLNGQTMIDDIKSRCRFCAEQKQNLVDIASFANFSIDIKNLIKLLNLLENDFFPSRVCEECFSQIVLIETFMAKCKTANEFLWEKAKQLRTVSAVDVIYQEERVENEEEIENSYGGSEQLNESYGDIIVECESENETPADFTIETIVKSSEVESCDVKNEENETGLKNTWKNISIIEPKSEKSSIKNFNCEVCLKVFSGQAYQNHTCDVPEISCDKCGENFKTFYSLNSHKQRIHQEQTQKNYCSHCKAVIVGKKSVFRKHTAKCSQRHFQGEINCEYCDKTFTTLHSYTVHKIFHESKTNSKKDSKDIQKKSPPVICELCGKTYTTVGDCRRHIKLKHTEITEKFSCDICQKSYPTKSVLKDHIRNTHVIKEVACTFCGKIFRNKTHLQKHLIYHDESKKIHKCFICPERPGFFNKFGLIRHQAKHAKEENNFL